MVTKKFRILAADRKRFVFQGLTAILNLFYLTGYGFDANPSTVASLEFVSRLKYGLRHHGVGIGPRAVFPARSIVARGSDLWHTPVFRGFKVIAQHSPGAKRHFLKQLIVG